MPTDATSGQLHPGAVVCPCVPRPTTPALTMYLMQRPGRSRTFLRRRSLRNEKVRAANAKVVSSPVSRVEVTAVSLRLRLCGRGARKEEP